MAVKVVDASAMAALVFGENEAGLVRNLIRGHNLVAPALLWFEIGSICLKKLKLHPPERAATLAGQQAFLALSVSPMTVDHGAVPEMAERLGLSAYDASYLALALDLPADLVTLDQRLARVAHAAGVST